MNYQDFIKKTELDENILTFNYNPKISIIIPIYNISDEILKETLNSVFTQSYKNWELCIADASDKQSEIVKGGIALISKVKIKYIENKNIADNTNEAISLATGDYITFLDHDDMLAPNALYEIVKTINETNADFIYSDEDKILGNQRLQPHFKPDWSPDTLRSYNYICHLVCIKKELFDEVGGMLYNEYNGSQDYDLVLRCTEKAKNIVHIQKILYHWRIVDGSTAQKQENKMYAYVSAKKALRHHLKRIGNNGEVQDGLFLSSYKICYNMYEKPLVSILIPNHNQLNLLKKCLTSIFKLTKYPNYEIVIIENNSTDEKLFEYYEQLKKKNNVKIVEWNNQPFNYAKITNFGVEHCSGEYVLFLNNDTMIINEDWLNRMMEYIVRSDVGIVGAKLYYPDDSIQHAGVILGLGKEGMPGHVYCKAPRNFLGYMGRLKIVQNLMAVTGACLLTKKKVLNEVGGLDEFLVLAFNDIDYCFKVYDKGYRIVWTPYAELYHFESQTRGYEDTPEKVERFWKEFRYLKIKWDKLINKGDNMFPIEGLIIR